MLHRQFLFTILFFLCLRIDYAFSSNGDILIEPFHIKYSEKEGLIDDEIYDLTFDENGFLWIGTDKGLQRFDGQKFLEIKNPKIKNEAAAVITLLGEDSVCYTDMRGSIFKANAEGFEKIDIKFPPQIDIPKFYYSPAGNLWVFSHAGSVMIDKKGNQVIKKKLRASHLIETQDELIALLDSIKIFDKEMNFKESFGYVDGETEKYRLNATISPYGLCIAETHKNDLILLKEGKTQEIHSLKRPVLVLHYHGNSLFIGTRDGLDEYIWDGETFDYVNSYFQGSQISAFCSSPTGELWIGTLGEGLIRVFDTKLKNYRMQDTRDYISKIQNFNDYILAGTNKGRLYAINKNFGISNISTEVKYMSILDIFPESEASFIISSDSLYRYDLDFKPSNLGPAHGSNQFILNPTGEYYSNAWGGIKEFKSSNFLKPKYIHRPRFRNPVNFNRWMLLSRDEMAYALNSLNGKIDTLSLYSGTVRKILASEDLALFQVDKNNEIVLFNKELEIVDTISNHPDLGTLVGFYKIDTSYFLIGSKKVGRYHPHKGIVEFNLIPGFQNTEIIASHVFNDKIYLSHTFGLLPLSLELFRKEKYSEVEPHFRIRKILLNGEVLSLKNEYKIPSGRSQVEIFFELRDFDSPNFSSLTYSLSNKKNKDHWLLINSELRSIVLNELPDGKSKLEIRDSEKSLAHLSFSKAYPFWQKTWFFAFCVAFGLLISFPIYRVWNLNKEKRNQEKLKRIELEKILQTSNLTSLKAQLNPHFLFNALNAIQSFMLKKDRVQASNYLNRFSKLMRTILQHSMEDLIVLNEEIEAIKLYLQLENLRFENSIQIEFDVAKDLDLEEINIPAMIIQPFVENAIKHGLTQKNGEKRLYIGFQRKNNMLEVIVEDNGIGREAALKRKKNEEHMSVSEGINRKRLEIINQLYNANCDLEIVDKLDEQKGPTGTKIILGIPIDL